MPSDTVTEVPTPVGIAIEPTPSEASDELLTLTLAVWPSQVSEMPATVTDVISYRLSVASHADVYDVVTPSVSHEATAVLSAPTFELATLVRLAANA